LTARDLTPGDREAIEHLWLAVGCIGYVNMRRLRGSCRIDAAVAALAAAVVIIISGMVS
jgi:hypothetical protein